MFVPNFKILGEVVAEKCVTNIFIWEKENGQLKEWEAWEFKISLTQYK